MKRLFARILITLGALAFGAGVVGTGSAMAADPAGHAFCSVAINGKEDMQKRTDVSLAADPSGHKALSGCRGGPLVFLKDFQRHDPRANLQTVADLHRYIGNWTTEPAQKGYMYNSDCLYDQAGGGYGIQTECRPRDLYQGEVIYKSATGVLIMLSHCANPGVVVIPPIVVTANPCYEIRFPSVPKGAVRVAHLGTRPLPGRCLKLQLAGESAPRFNFPEECPDTYNKVVGDRVYKVVCSWQDVEAAASRILGHRVQVQNVSFSFYGRADGTNVLYVPAEALDGETAICYELPNGTFVTKGVRRESFVGHVATVTRDMVFGH